MFDEAKQQQKTIIRIPEVTQKTAAEGKIIYGNEEGWSDFDFSVIVVDLPISDFCNMKAGCCTQGVIFNSRTPAANRTSVLGSVVSQSLGVYDYIRKESDTKETSLARRAEYQNQYSRTSFTLDWAPEEQSWVILKYDDDTKNANLWKGPRLEVTNSSTLNNWCINQKYSFNWEFSSRDNEYEMYEIATQCLDTTAFWESESEVINEPFQKVAPPVGKKRRMCQD